MLVCIVFVENVSKRGRKGDTGRQNLSHFDVHMTALGRDGRFGSKVSQIGHKWDKSGAFSDQISVHLKVG